MIFRQLIDKESSTYTYILGDPETREAVIIDPVREQFERDTRFIDELGLRVLFTIETHMHADHITSSGLFRRDKKSQSIVSFFSGADCADSKVNDGDEISFGEQRLIVLTTPGHTNGCMSLHSPKHKMVFTGDALMIRGCGRTDFQEGSAIKLFESVHSKIFTLPDETLVFPAHDYKGRTVSSVREEKKYNPRLGGGNTKEEFCRIMSNLDLSYPKKIDEAVPANLQCGILSSDEKMKSSSQLSPSASDSWAPIHRRQDIPEVNTKWVKKNMETLRLIDIRDVAEFYSLPPLPSSELIPMNTLLDALKDTPKDERIVIICRSGIRSATMVISMEQQGFICVASMKGGMQDWVVSSVGNCGK